MSEQQSPDQPTSSDRPRAYAWYVAGVLMLAYMLSFIDRKLPFILAESIKEDLSLSDTQVGLITGAMFSLVYATVAIPIASLSDRSNRKRVIATAVFVWSSITALGGLAQNFWQLSASRIGVAVGESACTPAAHSIIADYFKPAFRARALAFYMAGSQVGVVLGLGLGGWINEMHDWRTAMFMLGAPGVLLTLVIAFTVKEPARAQPHAGSHGVSAATIPETLRALFGQPAFVHMMIGGVLMSVGGAGLAAFAPSFVIRTFGLTSGQVGLTYGLALGTAGIAGTLLGGVIADRLRRREPRHILHFCAAALFATAPLLSVALLSPTYAGFLVCVALSGACTHAIAAPVFSIVQSMVEPRMHAVASAVFLFALSGVGAAVGPVVVGALSDWFVVNGSPNSLRSALLVSLAPTVWGVLHFLRAANRYGRAAAARPAPAPAE